MYKHITLEVSFKPFKQTDDEYIRSVCNKIYTQWYPLIKDSETVSVMFWASDGSEILEYTGNMDEKMEWCQYIGTANLPFNPTGDDAICPHKYKYNYIDNPPVITYRVMKRIVELFKEEGKKLLPDAKILVGDTFDIGPEFAASDFKYNRHTEICTGQTLDRYGFVDCTATLHSDTKSYAAYKDGIPEGTPLASFLGKQTEVFLKDMGMDFVWLSNGFGFSADPWSLQGRVYDGENFYPDKLSETRKKVLGFWKMFREECHYPVRVRGTNNTVGVDYATDAVPIYEIYKGGFDIEPPPNSPWAALNDNYGLEIMGHMTRICELPCDDFLFRYYIHDPWWLNSPWYDRYGSEPIDIYLPMAITRIKEDGSVQSADNLNILSVDNSFGDMPDSCVNEPLPHLIKAKKDAGDRPAPFMLLYPVREYSTAMDEETIKQMYKGDRYIVDAINNSLPLNCVVSTDIFLKNSLDIYKNSVIITPVPETQEIKDKLITFINGGGQVIIYGTEKFLKKAEDINAVKINVESAKPTEIREVLKNFGYLIDFNNPHKNRKTTTMTIANDDNALFFSLYNQTTALDMYLKFPLGVPVFIGSDAIIENGVGKYHFSRCEHLECRVFVKQENGIVSLREGPACNRKYRRRIRISGLENATVYFFPEAYCRENAVLTRDKNFYGMAPVVEDCFILEYDKRYGSYFKAENLTGDYQFLLPFPEYL
ncbi:MAG: hypothetical protein U0M42_09070 [Acutalibacteraceae bacterium]|nr:hypothetical protein [Acutalibacteraceae bacterium]